MLILKIDLHTDTLYMCTSSTIIIVSDISIYLFIGMKSVIKNSDDDKAITAVLLMTDGEANSGIIEQQGVIHGMKNINATNSDKACCLLISIIIVCQID